MEPEVKNKVPLIAIELDRKRHLRLGLLEMSLTEIELTKRLGQRTTYLDIIKSMGALEIQTLIWAGLRHEDPKIRWEEVGEMLGALTGESLANLQEQISCAFATKQ